MNTHLVMLDNIMLCTGVAQSSLLPFPVAPSAEFWDIARKYVRIRIGPGLYAVRAMAVGTDRSIRIVLGGQHAMGAFVIKVDNLGMTDGTVHLT